MISIFKNVRSRTGSIHLEMWQILERIRTGNSKKQIKAIAKADPKKKGGLKVQLPCICFSGKFEERKDAAILQHSGFICLDFDKLGADLPEIKEQIAQIPFTYAVFISPSGNGLKVLVKVPASVEQHRDHYRAAMRFYAEATHNLYKPDEKCLNESRICFEAFDPDIFTNVDSSIFTEQLDQEQYKLWLKPPAPPAAGQAPLTAPVPLSKRDWADHVKQVTAQIIADAVQGDKHASLVRASNLMGGYISAGHIEEGLGQQWLQDCIGKKAGVSDLELAKRTIQDGIAHGRLTPVVLDSSYNFDGETYEPYSKTDKEVYAEAMEHLKEGKLELEELGMHMDHIAKRLNKNIEDVQKIFEQVYTRHADIKGWNSWLEIQRVEHFLLEKFDFIRNKITLQTEYKLKNDPDYLELNEDSIYRMLQHHNFKFALDKLRSLLRSDFIEGYHPIEKYFASLPMWDGKTDYIAQLAGYIKVADQPFFTEQLKKTLLRCIACSTSDYVNRIVFTLVGEKQETGKSSFIRFLNPFGEAYYSEAPMKDSKDTEIAFSENFIYNMEELAALKVYEVDKLKSVISRGMIKEREAYGKRAVSRARICNFFASTNNREFLTDSENTRWLVFEVEKINHDYCNYITGTREIDINHVWAQAYSLYKAGYEYNLTESERQVRDTVNKQYEVISPERQLIMKYLELCEPGEGGFMTTTDVQILISQESAGNVRINSKAVGMAMRALGFTPGVKRVSGHVVRGYEVKLSQGLQKGQYEDVSVILDQGVFKVEHNPQQAKLFDGNNSTNQK